MAFRCDDPIGERVLGFLIALAGRRDFPIPTAVMGCLAGVVPLEIVPINASVGARFKTNAQVPERLDPIAGVQHIESAETVLIPTKDHVEIAQLTGIGNHLLKAGASLRGVAADAFVLILADDGIAVLGR